jgi:hypothetical protein
MNRFLMHTSVLTLGLALAAGTAYAGGQPGSGSGHSGSSQGSRGTPPMDRGSMNQGQRILTASDDGTARLWDAVTGEEAEARKIPFSGFRWAVLSSDGRRLVTTYDCRWQRVPYAALIWDSQTGRTIRFRGPEDTYQFPSLSADGSKLLACTDAHHVRIWDARTGKELAVLKSRAWCGCFSPDGKWALTADGSGRIWDVATGKELALLPGDEKNPIHSGSFSPDGKRVLTLPSGPTSLRVLSFPSGPGSLQGGPARIWDAASGKLLLTVDIGGHFAVFSPDPEGRHLLADLIGGQFLAGGRVPEPGPRFGRHEDETAVWAEYGLGACAARENGHLPAGSRVPDSCRPVVGRRDDTPAVWTIGGRAGSGCTPFQGEQALPRLAVPNAEAASRRRKAWTSQGPVTQGEHSSPVACRVRW